MPRLVPYLSSSVGVQVAQTKGLWSPQATLGMGVRLRPQPAHESNEWLPQGKEGPNRGRYGWAACGARLVYQQLLTRYADCTQSRGHTQLVCVLMRGCVMCPLQITSAWQASWQCQHTQRSRPIMTTNHWLVCYIIILAWQQELFARILKTPHFQTLYLCVCKAEQFSQLIFQCNIIVLLQYLDTCLFIWATHYMQ